MKVISQLAWHFWSRGALTVEQAEYLVSHGFVKAHDLEGFKTGRLSAWNSDDADARHEALRVLTPEESLHAVGDVLVSKTVRGRSKGPRPSRSVLDEEGLRDALRSEFGRRAPALAALGELAGPLGGVRGWDEAVVVLRNASDEDFRDVLRSRLRERPAALASLWSAVDREPFHALIDGPASRGPAARAFGALLRTRDPGRLGKYVWILRLAEVAAVGNLLQVGLKLMTALERSSRERDRVLTDAQRDGLPADLFWAFVLLYNADRALVAEGPFGPAGASDPAGQPTDAAWQRAATNAVLMQPEALPRLLEMAEGQEPLVRPWAWRIAP